MTETGKRLRVTRGGLRFERGARGERERGDRDEHRSVIQSARGAHANDSDCLCSGPRTHPNPGCCCAGCGCSARACTASTGTDQPPLHP
eukprot:1862604-Rhodomonas_salina.1